MTDPIGSCGSRAKLDWYLDVGDTLLYFTGQRRPSGIQRVVMELHQALQVRMGARLRLVAASPNGRGVFSLDPGDWQQLLRSIDGGSPDACRVARGILNRSLDGPPITSTGADGLIVLGAPWVTRGYVQSLVSFWDGVGPLVPLVHDLTPLRWPQHHDASVTYRFRQALTVFSLASAILVNSEFTGQDLKAWLDTEGLETPPVRTIRLAPSLAASLDESKGVRSDLARPFAAIVSTIEGRKGHLLALTAWERLLDEVPSEQVPDLVLVGRYGWNGSSVRRFLDSRRSLKDRVVVTGSISDAELAWIYSNALFTIYPSEYEGWGLPVSESIAFGTPVIASDSASIPEAGGDSAQYFKSGDTDSLYAVLHRWLLEPDLIETWRVRIAQARHDTWSDVAARVELLLEDVEERTARDSPTTRRQTLHAILSRASEGGPLSAIESLLAFNSAVSFVLPFGSRRRQVCSEALRRLARAARRSRRSRRRVV